MSQIRKALTRKLGPLPAWAWAGIVGVGLLLYRRHAASTGSQSQQDAPTFYGPYGQDGGGTIQGGAGTGPGDSGNQQPPVIIVNPPAPGKRRPKPKPQHNKKRDKPKGHEHGKGVTPEKAGGGWQRGRHTTTNHGQPNVDRPRHPATTHNGSHTRTRGARASTRGQKSWNVNRGRHK